MKTAAVIPAYNEERTIKEVIERTLGFVDRAIVVVDGSTDDTAKRAMETGASVIVLPENMGKAEALKAGFREAAGFDHVVMLDGDLQHCPEEIPLLIEHVEDGADLCIGSRFFNGTRSMPWSNKISNHMAQGLLWTMTGRRITDPQSGFRALKGEALEKLELRADRYAIEHIMILEAARKRFNIKEAPISCVYGEERSHIRPVRDTINVTRNILGFMLRSRR